MDNCLFCKIIDGSVPSKKVYEDDKVYAFEDIDPKAPLHILIIPKKHMASIMEMEQEDCDYMTSMVKAAQTLAKERGADAKGFRLVVNTGEDGGQTVGHLHMHLLAGRSLGWPPG